jgi:hypothetical protein
MIWSTLIKYELFRSDDVGLDQRDTMSMSESWSETIPLNPFIATCKYVPNTDLFRHRRKFAIVPRFATNTSCVPAVLKHFIEEFPPELLKTIPEDHFL